MKVVLICWIARVIHRLRLILKDHKLLKVLYPRRSIVWVRHTRVQFSSQSISRKLKFCRYSRSLWIIAGLRILNRRWSLELLHWRVKTLKFWFLRARIKFIKSLIGVCKYPRMWGMCHLEVDKLEIDLMLEVPFRFRMEL